MSGGTKMGIYVSFALVEKEWSAENKRFKVKNSKTGQISQQHLTQI
jgi:hypothetical protein